MISKLLRPGEIMTIVGPAKCGMSMLALNLAAAVASGKSWLGKFPCAQGRVLVVNNELRQHEHEQRCAALKIPALGVIGAKLGSEPDGLLLKAIEDCSTGSDYSYSLIIFDQEFSVFNECDNDKATLFNRGLSALAEKTKTAIVIVNRMAKEKSGPAGDGVATRMADTTLSLTPHEMGSAYTVDARSRSFPHIEPFRICFQYPHWRKYFS